MKLRFFNKKWKTISNKDKSIDDMNKEILNDFRFDFNPHSKVYGAEKNRYEIMKKKIAKLVDSFPI